jgi:DNA ligase-1
MDQEYATYFINEDIPDVIDTDYIGISDPRTKLLLEKKKWYFNTLYKWDANGSLRFWRVGCDLNKEELFTESGVVDGAVVYSPGEVNLNKSGRSFHVQAVQQAKQRYLEKFRDNSYRPAGEPPLSNQCMLANTWIPDEMILTYPVATQPKLDGMRCLVKKEGNKLIYSSRENVIWKHLNFFTTELMPIFEQIPYNIILDGELYIHGMDFEDITSIVKNMTKLHPRLKDLTYCIFTFNTTEYLNFLGRTLLLNNIVNKLALKRVVLLDTVMCNSKEEVLSVHQSYRSLGFEGTMIYNLNALYTTTRTMDLLKHKDWIEEEGIVMSVKRGKGREKDLAILSIKDQRGVITSMRPTGKFEQRRIWYQNPETIIGKRVTFKYQNLTQNNVPRFAVVLGEREIL